MRRSLSRVLRVGVPLAAWAAAAAAGPRASQPPYQWSVSASDVDPFVNTAQATYAPRTLYLWLIRAADGMASAEFSVLGSTQILSVTGVNGFVVHQAAGRIVQIVHPGCPQGPVIAAELLVLDVPGALCFSPSAADADNCTEDCAQPPAFHRNSYVGFASDGSVPCALETWSPCSSWPTGAAGAVATTPWGTVKAGYR